MKALYIIRHAKSSWDYPQLSDEERPLNEKGIKRSNKLGNFLKSKDVLPDIMISSHANRAFHTAQLIAKKINFPEKNIIIDRSIYSSSVDNIFSIIFGISDNYNSVIMIGHNPTFTNFSNYFLDDKIDNLPTSGMVYFEFETDNWNEIITSTKLKNYLILPKEL